MEFGMKCGVLVLKRGKIILLKRKELYYQMGKL